MLTKCLQDWPISDEKKLAQVKHEVELFEEIYALPKRNGVKNLFVPNIVKEIMYDRIKFIKNKNKKDLLKRLLDAGLLLGFNENGYVYVHEKQDDRIDLASALPTKDSKPFFVWQPNAGLLNFMDGSCNLENNWMDRKLGPIYNSLDIALITDPKEGFYETLREGGIETHALSISSVNVWLADLVFKFQSTYTFSDNFRRRIEFYFKNGKTTVVQQWQLMRLPGKQKVITPLDNIVSGVEKIHEAGVTPQHLLYYIENANLSHAHLEAIAEIINFLKTTPKKTVSELFPAQEITEVRRAQSFDASVAVIQRCTPSYRFIDYKTLTPSEFSLSRIPDKCVQSVVVEADKYAASFVPSSPPYLCICGPADKYFSRVVWTLATQINKMHWIQNVRLGQAKLESMARETTSQMLLFRLCPHQEDIAKYITQIFTRHFKNITVTLHYKNVPRKAFENSGLPNEKATLADEILV